MNFSYPGIGGWRFRSLRVGVIACISISSLSIAEGAVQRLDSTGNKKDNWSKSVLSRLNVPGIREVQAGSAEDNS